MTTVLYRADNLKVGFTGRIILNRFGMYAAVYGQDGKVVIEYSIASIEQGKLLLKEWGII